MNCNDRQNRTTAAPAKRRRRLAATSSTDEQAIDSENFFKHTSCTETQRDDHESKQGENEQLVAKERDIVVKIEELSEENQQLLQKCEVIEQEKTESQHQLQTCQVHVAQLEEVADTLGDKNKSLIKKLKDARADIDSLRKYALASDQSIADSRHEMSFLRNRNDALMAEINSASASLSTLSRAQEALLQQCKDERTAKEGLERENDALQEKFQRGEIAIAILWKQTKAHKAQKESLRDQLEKTSKKVAGLAHQLENADTLRQTMKAEFEDKLHKLQNQSLKSLLAIQTSNKNLKSKVSKIEDMLVQDAQCMRDLFIERDDLKRRMLEEQKKSLKQDVDGQVLQSTLQRHQHTLTKVEEQLGRSTQSEGGEQDLVREKTEMQQLVSKMKKKHLVEVEALHEEIKQLKTGTVELKEQLGRNTILEESTQQLLREKMELQQLVSKMKTNNLEKVESLQEEMEKRVAIELGFL
ncbi:unnamed protein product [Cylindrotheca closterium]|uniref:Uncharacterized protein n=1 Tax=Cylindrotheca closterium TaxID=2856 RepID=A0AAD2CBU6_9STRA|nr:unnamed protein product [Cylindrotheca closterium]